MSSGALMRICVGMKRKAPLHSLTGVIRLQNAGNMSTYMRRLQEKLTVARIEITMCSIVNAVINFNEKAKYKMLPISMIGECGQELIIRPAEPFTLAQSGTDGE